jgi:hypothetical protein
MIRWVPTASAVVLVPPVLVPQAVPAVPVLKCRVLYQETVPYHKMGAAVYTPVIAYTQLLSRARRMLMRRECLLVLGQPRAQAQSFAAVVRVFSLP